MKKVLIQTKIVPTFLTLAACNGGAAAGEALFGPVWVATSLNGSNLLPGEPTTVTQWLGS